MIELIITYEYPDGNKFYIYSDSDKECGYLTMSKCHICGRPHELLDLLVSNPSQNPPYDVLYECPTTHDTAELIVVISETPV